MSNAKVQISNQAQISKHKWAAFLIFRHLSFPWHLDFAFELEGLKMELVFKRPECLIDVPFHFCPGCHHGIAHRLVAEAIDYFKIREKTIGVASVGCSVFMYDYFNVDVLEAPHGRASAVASGVKRGRKDLIVFTIP